MLPIIPKHSLIPEKESNIYELCLSFIRRNEQHMTEVIPFNSLWTAIDLFIIVNRTVKRDMIGDNI